MLLTLLIPELLWSDPDDRSVWSTADTSTLATLLPRASFARQPTEATESCLARLCGRADAPLAALRAAGDGLDAHAGAWVCADPVHLRFHQERLIVGDASQLALTADDAGTLIGELNAEFHATGRFLATTPERWYLRPHSALIGGCGPLSHAVGREMTPDSMAAEPTLRRLGHETQMALHASPLNARRSEAGQLPVNALWLWGGGRLDHADPFDPPPALAAKSPIAQGIARLAGSVCAPPAASLADQLAEKIDASELLVELDDLLLPAAYQDAAAWREAWEKLARDWFSGLPGALRSGRIEALRLVSPTAFGSLEWRLSRRAAWKFWQAAEPLSTLARRLGTTS